MPKVDSSTILSYDYDSTKQILTIKFRSGRSYNYQNVPKEIATNFATTESKGSYFHNVIKDYYKTEEL